MPRGGGGDYQLPPNVPDQQSNTTIQASWGNSFSADMEATFNTTWPLSLLPTIDIAHGGTNAITAVGGIDNLSTKSSNIASAATTDLSTATGQFVHITGTTTITSFGTSPAGVVRNLVLDGALTLTHNATSLILPGGSSIITAAGDRAVAISEGSGNWNVLSYTRAAGGYPRLHVRDEKASGTGGGISAGSVTYSTRVLNTVVANEVGATLVSNVITLLPGTYKATISAPAYRVDGHRIRLITSGSTVLLWGSSEYSYSVTPMAATRSFIQGQFTLAATTGMTIEHYVGTQTGTNDLGAPAGSGSIEIYTEAIFERLI